MSEFKLSIFRITGPGEWLKGFGISSVIYTDPDFIHVGEWLQMTELAGFKLGPNRLTVGRSDFTLQEN